MKRGRGTPWIPIILFIGVMLWMMNSGGFEMLTAPGGITVVPADADNEYITSVKIQTKDVATPNSTIVVPEVYVYEIQNNTIEYRTDIFDVSNLNDLDILK